MLLTPMQMRQLMAEWEKKTPAADGSKTKPDGTVAKTSPDKTSPDKKQSDKTPAEKQADGKVARPDEPAPRRRRPQFREPDPPKVNAADLAKVRELMKNAEPMADGNYRFRDSADARQAIRSLPGWESAARAMTYGKSSPQLLREITPIALKACRGTAVVLCDGKPTVLGTVIRPDGYILTKSSELRGKLSCRIEGREFPATIVKVRREHDLALLKVNATDLEPVVWADSDSPILGSWLITPSAENDVLGLGVVSIAARTIPDAPTMLLRNPAVIGVLIDPLAKKAQVLSVNHGMPAERGGMKAGDVIEKIDGKAVASHQEVNRLLGKYKPGDRVVVQVARAGKPVALKLELVSSDRFAPKTTNEHVERLSEAGGTVSKQQRQLCQCFHARHRFASERLRRAGGEPRRACRRPEHRPRRPHRDLRHSRPHDPDADPGDAVSVGPFATRFPCRKCPSRQDGPTSLVLHLVLIDQPRRQVGRIAQLGMCEVSHCVFTGADI